MKKVMGVLFFITCFQINAQYVKILDVDSGLPIKNVLVENKEKNKRYFSNAEGMVDLSSFGEDELLFFSHLSFVNRQWTKRHIILKNNILYFNRNSKKLDEVVLSISKWQQQKKNIPHKVTSIQTEAIDFMGAQTTADILSKSGHIFVQKSQLGGGSPIIRGFAANRVLISVDGVRMNNAIFRSGNVQNIISIDPFAIQKTEVIFGPGSVIFGSDAIGGVMNFYTKQAVLATGDSLNVQSGINARYSSANQEKTVNISLNIGKKKWASFTNFTFNNFGDLKTGKNGPEDFLRPTYVYANGAKDTEVINPDPRVQTPTRYHQYNFSQKLRYVPSRILDMNLGVHFSKTSDYDRYDRLLEVQGNTPKYAVWHYGNQEWLMANFQLTRQSKSDLHNALKITTSYQKFKESRHDRRYNNPILRNRFEGVDAFSFNADFEKKTKTPIKFFYGFEYLFNKVHSTGYALHKETNITTNIPSRYPDGSTWQTVASYINSEYKPRNNITLLAGIRYSHIFATTNFDPIFYNFTIGKNNIHNGALTGSIGLSWFPGNNWQITLNGTTGFRAPNIDDLGKVFDSEPGSVVVPNISLRPEYAYNSEIGIKKKFYNAFFLNGSIFYTYISNALVRRDFTFNGQRTILYDGVESNVQAIQNAAQAYVYGIELDLEVYFNTHLSWRTSITFNRGEEELEDGSSDTLRHIAPLFLNSHLVWKNPKLTLDFFANYHGKINYDNLAPSEKNKPFIYAKDINGNPYVPEWHTINFKTEYRLNKKIKGSFALENITNQRYRVYSSGIAAPGTNIVLGASYDF